MANLGRLFRVLPPLLFSILFFSSILSLATASLPQDDDDSGNGEIGPLLADLRASVYVALIPLCVFCSVLIEDFAEPIRSDDADGEEMSNIIRDRLVCVPGHLYLLQQVLLHCCFHFFIFFFTIHVATTCLAWI